MGNSTQGIFFYIGNYQGSLFLSPKESLSKKESLSLQGSLSIYGEESLSLSIQRTPQESPSTYIGDSTKGISIYIRSSQGSLSLSYRNLYLYTDLSLYTQGALQYPSPYLHVELLGISIYIGNSTHCISIYSGSSQDLSLYRNLYLHRESSSLQTSLFIEIEEVLGISLYLYRELFGNLYLCRARLGAPL